MENLDSVSLSPKKVSFSDAIALIDSILYIDKLLFMK